MKNNIPAKSLTVLTLATIIAVSCSHTTIKKPDTVSIYPSIPTRSEMTMALLRAQLPTNKVRGPTNVWVYFNYEGINKSNYNWTVESSIDMHNWLFFSNSTNDIISVIASNNIRFFRLKGVPK